MKNKFIMATLFSAFLLVFSPNVTAANFTDNQIVDTNKTWAVRFTSDVGFDDTTKQGVTVTDSKGNIVPVVIQLGQDNKTVTVTAPQGGYTPGENYTLSVGGKAHSNKGKNLKNEYKVHFSIKNNSIQSGNINGNINNSGIVTKQGDTIYYADQSIGGICKIRQNSSIPTQINYIDDSYDINVVGNYVYYIAASAGEQQYQNRIYRIDLDGNSRVELSKDNASCLNVVGNYIYYVDRSDAFGDGNVCRMNLDGTNKIKLTKDIGENIVIRNGWIYYTNISDSGKLYKIKTDGSGRTKITEDSADYINIDDNYIYYKSQRQYDHYSGGYLYRMKLDGTEKNNLFNGSVDSINVANNYIYFTSNSKRALYKMKTDGTKLQALDNKGIYNDIYVYYYVNIVDDYIYFCSFSREYKMKTDGTSIEKISRY